MDTVLIKNFGDIKDGLDTSEGTNRRKYGLEIRGNNLIHPKGTPIRQISRALSQWIERNEIVPENTGQRLTDK